MFVLHRFLRDSISIYLDHNYCVQEHVYLAPGIVLIVANNAITIGDSDHVALQVSDIEVFRCVVIEIERNSFCIIIEPHGGNHRGIPLDRHCRQLTAVPIIRVGLIAHNLLGAQSVGIVAITETCISLCSACQRVAVGGRLIPPTEVQYRLLNLYDYRHCLLTYCWL